MTYAVKNAERQLRLDLSPPFRGALYRNDRSGKEWQVWEFDLLGPEQLTMRRERRLLGGFGWFRFLTITFDQLQRNWSYVGPTPRGHYLWGYDLADPAQQPEWLSLPSSSSKDNPAGTKQGGGDG